MKENILKNLDTDKLERRIEDTLAQGFIRLGFKEFFLVSIEIDREKGTISWTLGNIFENFDFQRDFNIGSKEDIKNDFIKNEENFRKVHNSIIRDSYDFASKDTGIKWRNEN